MNTSSHTTTMEKIPPWFGDGVDITTIKIDPQPNQAQFIPEVDLITRRSILGGHKVHCDEAKQDEFLKEYRREEAVQGTMNSSLLMTSSEIEPTQKKKRGRKPSNVGVSGDHLNNPQFGCAGRAPNDRRSSGSIDLSVVGNTSSIMELRNSIYHKYVNHFEAFYNDHDSLSLLTMLFHPCCTPDMTRDQNLWMPTAAVMAMVAQARACPVNTGSASIGNCPLQQSLSSLNVVRDKHMMLVKTRELYGREVFHNDLSYIINKLPDCLIFYRGTKIVQRDKMTIVSSPYDYFYTIPIHKKKFLAQKLKLSKQGQSQLSASSDIHDDKYDLESSSLMEPTSQLNEMEDSDEDSIILVKIELSGCNVLYFNDQGLVFRTADHLSVRSISHPMVKYTDLVNFMGF